jgi:TolB-like protein
LRYHFNDFTLDTRRRELRHGTELVAVEPQVFDLLEFLIASRERVVSRDDLLAAVWRGRIVSEATLSSRVNSARMAIGDNGEAQRLIKTLPRKGVRFVGEVREEPDAAAAPVGAPDIAYPDGPSIAVLPFTNMSGDPEQEYFADGMVEEIITALSRMRWLFVIARNSSFTYKGRAVDVRQVGRELGVRYLLQGSVRKAANRVRITGQLVDAITGAHLWADRFDGGFEDVFDLQDQVTMSVVGAIAPKLEQIEIERAKRKPTESLDAYDYYLRGTAKFYEWTREANNEAKRLFLKATELDREFALAYGMAARCYTWRKANGWIINHERDNAEAAGLAHRAIELGKDDATVLSFAGYTIAHVVGDLDTGVDLIDRALTLNPNFAAAWYFSGWVRVFLGEPETALEHLARAMRLSPLDSVFGQMRAATASAYLCAGRHDEAASWAEKAVRERPSPQVFLIAAASNAHAGRLDKAKDAIARLLSLNPRERISNLRDHYPLRRPEDLAIFADGLRRAGLPE